MNASGLNFLVVDDDNLLRRATHNLLRSLAAGGIREAANGTKALEILEHAAPPPVDIVLCDLNMPEMDGMEFLRHVGKTHPNVSVIIVSAHDDALISSVRKMASAYGVKLLGALHKPVSRAQLETIIKGYKPAPEKAAAPRKDTGPRFSLDEIMHGVTAKQFEPFYQPKVNLKTGRINGAEALARWLHPTAGVVGPYDFIDSLEKSGNIDGLTFLILEKAAAACRLLHDKGHLISVSVNLSLNSLGDVHLADKISQAVRSARIDPKYMILEVTESATMTEVAASLENLARLRMHGFGLSIDDYGTGSSNLQQMTRVAFSELKIDQSFVKNCHDNPELRVIVKSSIEMAHKLKIKCIAEGVETKEEWNALREMDCDTAQGYFIAKPMNLAAFLDFCATHDSKGLAGLNA